MRFKISDSKADVLPQGSLSFEIPRKGAGTAASHPCGRISGNPRRLIDILQGVGLRGQRRRGEDGDHSLLVTAKIRSEQRNMSVNQSSSGTDDQLAICQ